MTPYEAISLILSIISSVTVVLSLYLVYRQTSIFAKQTEYVARSLTESLSESMNNQSHEISQLFVSYPELRPYFYYSQPIDETHPDYHRAEAVAEVILDIFYTMSGQAQRFVKDAGVSGEEGGLWQEYVGDAFALSPILVNILTKRQGWYGQRMVEQMKSGLERHGLHEAR